MEGVQVVSISDLLLRRRPISGASSLLSSSPRVSPPAPSADARHQNPNSDIKVLNSLPRPSIIIGTLTLPSSENLSSRSGHDCFSFSCDSASVCCDVLQFDGRMIGRKIHVLAWNFIPFKHRSGFLEIIDWKFSEGSALDDGFDVFPVVSGEFSVGEESRKAWYGVHGLLMSVSPVSVVPCTFDGLRDEGGGSSSMRNLCGFIAQIFACPCQIYSSNDASRSFDHSVVEQDGHSFGKEVFVYFSGSAASWHPALLKLVGKVISLYKLRKKLVYIAEGEGVLMFITTHETGLYLPQVRSKGLPLNNCGIKGKGECGDYSGIVKGVYLKGMVVELDEEVWLVLTEPLLSPPHSIRVGAVISLRNVHFVNPNFPWRKMLILGACCNTSINVVSFSPLEARCHLPLQSKSMLGKYVECLPFSAKLWLLLVIQCFKKKFAGVFAEKELLGSKHSEGLAQSYARSMLPSSENHSTYGVFMQFCKHGLRGCHNELNYSSLTLAVPFLHFVNNCEVLWIKSLLQSSGGLEVIEQNNRNLLVDSRCSCQVMRRIFPSQYLGVSLLGNLKVSPYTGRLQLVDATSCIDAMVLDLPSTWNTADFYEVIDYTLVLEGVPERMNNVVMLDSDSFSCRSIFNCNRSQVETGLAIHVFFPWRNAIRRCFSSCNVLSSNCDLGDLKCGIFHVLRMTHIFPLQPHFQGDKLALEKSSMLAEAVPLSCYLYLVENDDTAGRMGISKEEAEEHDLSGFPCKRLKIDNACGLVQPSGVNYSESFGIRPCSHSIDFSTLLDIRRSVQKSHSTGCVEIPCLATIRGPHGESVVNSRILYPNRGKGRIKLKKVLLEFKPEYFFKYKLIRIGAYYVRKHYLGECFCDFKDPKYCDKVVIGPGRHLWSLSFSSNELFSNLDSSRIQSCYCSSHDISAVGCSRDELLIPNCSCNIHDGFADIHLHVSTDVVGVLDPDSQEFNEGSMASAGGSHYHQSSGRTMVSNSAQFPGASRLGCPLVEGDLVTVCGTVTALYSSDYSSIDGNSYKGIAGGIHQLKLFQGGRIFFSFHVLADGHMVKIDGSLNKFNYPVGLGPGANVSFHRILASSGKNCLMLLPTSFISVNSVGFDSSSNYSLCSSRPSRFGCDPWEVLPSSSICDFIKCSEGECRSLCCRVVAVHVLIFRRNKKLDKLLSEIQCRIPVVDIPLAGFVLDDGTSPCCCWANAERAATFLRLHDEMPATSSGGSWWEVQQAVADEPHSTLGFHLDKILKKHDSIIVKNYGSVLDTWCQDLQFNGSSGYKIGISDENVLKFIVLNACSGALLKVRGSVMRSSAASELEERLIGEQIKMDAMPNIWVEEVQIVNPLVEARAIFQNL